MQNIIAAQVMERVKSKEKGGRSEKMQSGKL